MRSEKPTGCNPWALSSILYHSPTHLLTYSTTHQLTDRRPACGSAHSCSLEVDYKLSAPESYSRRPEAREASDLTRAASSHLPSAEKPRRPLDQNPKSSCWSWKPAWPPRYSSGSA